MQKEFCFGIVWIIPNFMSRKCTSLCTVRSNYTDVSDHPEQKKTLERTPRGRDPAPTSVCLLTSISLHAPLPPLQPPHPSLPLPAAAGCPSAGAAAPSSTTAGRTPLSTFARRRRSPIAGLAHRWRDAAAAAPSSCPASSTAAIGGGILPPTTASLARRETPPPPPPRPPTGASPPAPSTAAASFPSAWRRPCDGGSGEARVLRRQLRGQQAWSAPWTATAPLPAVHSSRVYKYRPDAPTG
ncbi:hypothetical protein BRADI_3g23081v3 [Brachypodium distachyon]|uniref:Uncharacterized protein n=1 Tax=Brachypodium distachyon TaxID=15368 RepID=A0A0Q3FAV4_BRADI|nr:hypothetical protein BRADI_3g23081v3 [Brachypodium distachyon]